MRLHQQDLRQVLACFLLLMDGLRWMRASPSFQASWQQLMEPLLEKLYLRAHPAGRLPTQTALLIGFVAGPAQSMLHQPGEPHTQFFLQP